MKVKKLKKIFKQLFSLSILTFMIGMFILYVQKGPKIEETITYFPIDPSITYETANTTLTTSKKEDGEHYEVIWKTTSKIPTNAYLRHDISFLYVNGRLKEKMGRWEQNIEELQQQKKIELEDSSKVNSISFHYSELHPSENQYRSAQRMSSKTLYIIHSNYEPFHSFKQATSANDIQWKNSLDKITMDTLTYSWEQGYKKFEINPSHYDLYLLTDLQKYSDSPLKGFSKSQSDEIIGKLWEGLYKNYFLGIRKADGSIIDPIDSTIPLIFISKNKSHLLVLFETKEKESILLRQQIQSQN